MNLFRAGLFSDNLKKVVFRHEKNELGSLQTSFMRSDSDDKTVERSLIEFGNILAISNFAFQLYLIIAQAELSMRK